MKNNPNSYIEIARKALKGVSYMYGKGCSNEFSASAAKVAERYIKAVIEKYGDTTTDPSILKTHSMKRLYKEASKINGLNLDRNDTNILQGYYFDASYPGENFIEVSEEEEQECFEAMNNIAKAVEDFLLLKEGETSEFK